LSDLWTGMFTRRRLLTLLGIGAGVFGIQRLWLAGEPPAEPHAFSSLEREAMFYLKLEGDRVGCRLCFRQCVVSPGQRGFCRNRENKEGRLINIVYGLPSAVHIEPVEKEPLHHFLPGTDMLCIGTAGCNFRCKFCHNWHLSQRSLEQMHFVYRFPPEMAVLKTLEQGVPSISFTYNEPTSFYEYMYDAAQIAKKDGVRIAFHSNGAMAVEPLQALLLYTDAVAVDLKAFSNRFYREVCQAELAPVLLGLKIIKQSGVWLEIVNLVIPGQNDYPKEVQEMAAWIRDELGTEVPLHFSRFFPNYRMTDLSPTPVSTLERCRNIALKEGLKFVSIGNVPGHLYNSTFCPGCGELIINRHHFAVIEIRMDNGACRKCGLLINGVWQ